MQLRFSAGDCIYTAAGLTGQPHDFDHSGRGAVAGSQHVEYCYTP
ncbi:hypothetical protein [Streptomyces sp. NPDC047706]